VKNKGALIMLKCRVCGFEIKEPETCAKCGSVTQRYVKAIPLNDIDDVLVIKNELDAGNVLIVNIVPFLVSKCRAGQGFSAMTKIIDELSEYAISIDGDVARIGRERLILAPSSIKIWGSSIRSRMDSHVPSAT
jgi:uncharacterized protein